MSSNWSQNRAGVRRAISENFGISGTKVQSYQPDVPRGCIQFVAVMQFMGTGVLSTNCVDVPAEPCRYYILMSDFAYPQSSDLSVSLALQCVVLYLIQCLH